MSDLFLPAELEICVSWFQFQFAWLSRLDLAALLDVGSSFSVIFTVPQTRVTAMADIITSRWGDHLQYDRDQFSQLVAHFDACVVP